jgi:hypothetical protein
MWEKLIQAALITFLLYHFLNLTPSATYSTSNEYQLSFSELLKGYDP